MGDRANIGFKQPSGDLIWVYAHWNFVPGQAKALAKALHAASGRWNDYSYGNKLAIDSLFENGASGLTVNVRDDNEHKMYLVDWQTQTVHLLPEFDGSPGSLFNVKPIVSFTIPNFISKYGD